MIEIDLVQEENLRYREELVGLRQAIIQADPMVLVDGRFEQMITSPVNVIPIAQQLIAAMRQRRVPA
ncbi:MAG: hypothetical protein H6662_11590 [Ardenticatenaceae bacterium]|nr:hypothetical protein [Anaerolineales bacterium]MCB8922217.1 hypothetical protein [Ardenticatenaceae bacterium]